MRISLRGLVALLVAAALIGASPGAQIRVARGATVEGKTLNVPGIKQQGENWCWAATTQAILSYKYGIAYCQGTQASDLFNRSCPCGTVPPSALCDKPASLGQVQNLITRKSIVTELDGDALTYTDFKNEINRLKPLWVRIGWDGSLFNGHVMAVRGYYQDGTTPPSLGGMDPNKNAGAVRFPWWTWQFFSRDAHQDWSQTLWHMTR